MLDPRVGNIGLDANALDYDGVRDALVDYVLSLHDAGCINLIVPSSVRRETLHVNTPMRVRRLMEERIYTHDVSRTADEFRLLQQIQKVLQGNARAGKHNADGEHLFEAQKYCKYFITHDSRLLSRRFELAKILGNVISISTLEDLVSAYNIYSA